MFEKFSDELENYLKFLLSFANMHEEFKTSTSYKAHGLQFVDVEVTDKSLFQTELMY